MIMKTKEENLEIIRTRIDSLNPNIDLKNVVSNRLKEINISKLVNNIRLKNPQKPPKKFTTTFIDDNFHKGEIHDYLKQLFDNITHKKTQGDSLYIKNYCITYIGMIGNDKYQILISRIDQNINISISKNGNMTKDEKMMFDGDNYSTTIKNYLIKTETSCISKISELITIIEKIVKI